MRADAHSVRVFFLLGVEKWRRICYDNNTKGCIPEQTTTRLNHKHTDRDAYIQDKVIQKAGT